MDKFGVNQPSIQRVKGTGRLQVELPGVDNPDRVRKLLQGQAKLEFYGSVGAAGSRPLPRCSSTRR
ncbi:MAG: hypothetical protein WKG07_16465 [Hymenobacter sp.]